MGYRAEKLKVEGKVKRAKLWAFVVVSVLVAGLCVFSYFVPADSWKYYVSMPQTTDRADGELRMHFIDVGQGDCTLIEFPDGKTLLIDGGNSLAATEKTVLRYLNSLKIKKLDYLLLTHTDSDHCGGLACLLTYKDVETAFVPYEEDPTVNGDFAAFYEKLIKEDCETLYSARQYSFSSSDARYPYQWDFLYPQTVVSETENILDSNENSAVIWLDYQGVSALFCGDAPKSVEEKLMTEDKLGAFEKRGIKLTETEILKVAHHGSASSTGVEFLEYLGAKTAVISCGKDNLYGHPTKEVLDNLRSVAAETYRTDKNGHILITVKADGTYQTSFINK